MVSIAEAAGRFFMGAVIGFSLGLAFHDAVVNLGPIKAFLAWWRK